MASYSRKPLHNTQQHENLWWQIFRNCVLYIKVCFLFSYRNFGICGIHLIIPLSSLPYVGEERQSELPSWRDMLQVTSFVEDSNDFA
jgi:hypothetical protein